MVIQARRLPGLFFCFRYTQITPAACRNRGSPPRAGSGLRLSHVPAQLCAGIFFAQNTAELHGGTGFITQIYEIDCNAISALSIDIFNNKTLKNINLSNVHPENMVNIQHMTNNSHKMTISHTLINEKL
jgi:hypothetical protein